MKKLVRTTPRNDARLFQRVAPVDIATRLQLETDLCGLYGLTRNVENMTLWDENLQMEFSTFAEWADYVDCDEEDLSTTFIKRAPKQHLED